MFFPCSSLQLLSIKNQVDLIVGSLSGSRLKSVRFLVEKSGVSVTSDVSDKIIKINH